MFDPQKIKKFRLAILTWFATNKRELPWRGIDDPWHVLVSEIMLQQTQVDRVIPKYLEFVRRWPTPKAMAAAPLADVLRAWSGLGYNRRGANLHRAARSIMQIHGSRVPRKVEDLEGLPGIGPYTARAVASFAWNDDAPLWDTNVRRIVMRVFYGGEFSENLPDDRALASLLAAALPSGSGADWHAALMDFGSAVCISRKPGCASCPLARSCRAAAGFKSGTAQKTRLIRRQTSFEGSARQIRGTILKELSVAAGHRKFTELAKGVPRNLVRRAVGELMDEGLVNSRGDRVSLPSG